MRWYYANGNQQNGPISEEEFLSLVRSGTVQAGTLVWREGMPNWQPYSAVAASQPAPTPAPAPAAVMDAPYASPGPDFAPAGQPGAPVRYCSQCGLPHPVDEMVQFGDALVCANCKNVYAQRLREGVVMPGAFRYAGFWIRLAALFIDGLLVGLVSLFIVLPIYFMTPSDSPLKLLAQLFAFALSIGYEVFFLTNYSATPGKMACGLRVARADGMPLTFGLALGRCLSKQAIGSILTLYLGSLVSAIMTGIDPEKRSLHDRICNTRVIYK